ncbi:flagellar hook-length control protein FliK [Halomonas daqingensis]|uniref:Flagellar hook-length control protein FliK n=1 Tax=Billgrantia desiderata TaxID=52021 RepID=A0ABS9AZ49_9GAMM|nr:flagellar hook-length control protein FliK [Halomonas desiderata]MCE8040540.1 flagellar hook-length control protein FliK [Halomonas desiderata]MCE8045115.1 flagellar hook-length control protein FliK [Halomonas desiderata]
MNIQMILSALPNQLPGKHEAGAAPEHFALALDQASNGYRTGDTPLPAPLSGTAHGLPQTMAAQQALLQALQVNADHRSGSENGHTDANTQLDEIMARLALIDGSFVQEQDAVSMQTPMPQTDSELKIASDADAADQAERQAATFVAAAMPAPGSAGEMHMAKGDSASLTTAGQAVAGQGQAAQAAVLSQAAMAVDRGVTVNADEALARTASSTSEFTTAFARTTQTGGELRAMTPDAPRAGFVPEATNMAQLAGAPAGQPQAAAQPALPTQATLTAPLQSPNWPAQLGQQLVQFARIGGEQQVEMRLNPAELGPLSVTLKMTEQGAQAQFLASHAQVRQVLEQAIPQLREALAEQGITLGETSVGEQRRHDAQAFANQDGRQGQGGSASGEEEAALAAADEAATNTTATLSMDGRVNLYA